MGIISRQIVIKGNVQGVFFRMSTKEKADNLGLKGFVRNEKNGSVYIELEGEELLLNKMLEWLNVGPPNANVTEIDVKDHQIKGFVDFVIRRH